MTMRRAPYDYDKIRKAAPRRTFGAIMPPSDEAIEAFLLALMEYPSIKNACEMSGLTYAQVAKLRRDSEDFAAALDEARRMGMDHLEDAAVQRAVRGVEKPVFYQGTECGTVTEYSDTLLMFLLKAERPDKYREPKASDKQDEAEVHVHITPDDADL